MQVWKASKEYQELLREIEDYNNEFAIGGSNLEKFVESRRAQQAKAQYVLEVEVLVWLCLTTLGPFAQASFVALHPLLPPTSPLVHRSRV